MFLFASALLPSTPQPTSSAPLVRIVQDPATVVGAPLFVADSGGGQTQTGETPAPTSPGIYSIPVAELITAVQTLVIAGITYLPAQDIGDLQPGEYYYDPYQQVIVVNSSEPIQNTPYYLTAAPFVIPANLIPQPYPTWISQIPVAGDITWQLKLNEQPTGAMQLQVVGDAESMKTTLQAGLAIDLWGIAVALSQPQFTEYHRRDTRHGAADVQSSFMGVWEWQADQPVFWRGQPAGFNFSSQSNGRQCSPIGEQPASSSQISSGTTVQALAAQVGVALQAPTIPVSIPRDAEAQDTTGWTEYLITGALINNSFIDWTSLQAVRLQSYASARTWSYTESQINDSVQISLQQADAAPVSGSPSWRVPPVDLSSPFPDTVVLPQLTLQPENLSLTPAFRYTNHKVQGEFLDSRNDTSSTSEVSQLPTKPPEWTRLPSVSKTLIAGDPDPASSPGNPEHLSCNADVSGLTKRQVVTRISNGAPISEQITIYGWMFSGQELDSSATWGIIEQRDIQYRRDGGSGYDLGHTVTGFKMIRHRIENSDNPETLSLPANDPKRDLYRYRKVPLSGGRSVKLAQIRDFYPSYEVSPPYSVYEICGANGTITPVVVYDPSWVEPMFVVEELEWTRCIDRVPNPESKPNAPKPDLMAGEETYNWRKTEPIAIKSGDGTISQDPDGYRTYTMEFRAQEAGFARSLEQAPFEEFLGFPPEASRNKSGYELQEQPSPDNETESETVVTANLYIRSADYDGPPVGTLSFTGVRTLNEFKLAAQTNLLEQRHETLKETLTLAAPNFEIRPGDKFTYVFNGFQRQRRVLEVRNTANVQGIEKRIVTGSTELVLGVDFDNSLGDDGLTRGLTSRSTNAPPQINVVDVYYPGRTLGEIQSIPSSTFRY